MNVNGEKIRIRVVFVLFIFFALILILRLYQVQIIHGQEYTDKADHQYVSFASQLYDRGNIFFENKDGTVLSAATLATGYTISLNPSKIQDVSAVYKVLSEALPLSVDSFYIKANKKNSVYEKIADRVSADTVQKIESFNLAGVEIKKDRWRYYPGLNIAARTLGFVGYDGDILTGRYGLEKYYNDVLSRDSDGGSINFFAEVFSNIQQSFSADSLRQGDLVITLEPSVQMHFEKVLQEVNAQYSAKLTAGIIIDPMTGEIYAMAVQPTFDLNKFNEVQDISIFTNPLVEGVYEMGSIIKPLTLAAGLDAGVITAKTKYYDTGSLTLDGYTVYNHDKKARGTVDMQEVLSQSLNLGVAFVVDKMGRDTFKQYMLAYGLDEETGIDLPGENHGRLDNLDNPRQIEYATASFGQGIALTPIATVSALSTLANGGRLIVPHLVKRINYTTGLHKNVSYVNEAKTVLKKETSEEISRMLTVVVDKALAGGKVSLPHYSVAAKTGTAQIAKPGGGYYDDRWLHSFFGYFPSYEPRFLIFMYTVEPKGTGYASQTLTDPFMNMVQFLINYYNITPDR